MICATEKMYNLDSRDVSKKCISVYYGHLLIMVLLLMKIYIKRNRVYVVVSVVFTAFKIRR